MKKILSFLLLTCCSTLFFNGCHFESELFGSAADTLKTDTFPLTTSSSVSSDDSDDKELFSHAQNSQQETATHSDAISSSSSEKNHSQSSSPDVNIPDSSLSSPQESSVPDISSSDNDIMKSPVDSPLLNSVLKTLNIKNRDDSLALLLCSPLRGQLDSIHLYDSLTLSDDPTSTFLLIPIYNNSTLEIYELNFDGETYTDDTLLYRKAATPPGYVLDIQLTPSEETAAFRVFIKYGNSSGNYILVCNRLLHDNGEYLLKDNTLSPFNYLSDSIDLLTRKDALISAVTYITNDFSSTYNWEFLSDSMIRLHVENGDDPLSGEYYLESSELRDGKGCCYYAVSLSRRSYDESGNAIGEIICNRYLVTLTGNQIIPMVNEAGNLNTEYNDIII